MGSQSFLFLSTGGSTHRLVKRRSAAEEKCKDAQNIPFTFRLRLCSLLTGKETVGLGRNHRKGNWPDVCFQTCATCDLKKVGRERILFSSCLFPPAFFFLSRARGRWDRRAWIQPAGVSLLPNRWLAGWHSRDKSWKGTDGTEGKNEPTWRCHQNPFPSFPCQPRARAGRRWQMKCAGFQTRLVPESWERRI